MNAQETPKSFFNRNAILSIFFLVAIVALGNVLVRNRLIARADLTEDKENSVSEATKKILAELPGQVTIKAYISQEVPSQIVILKDRMLDVLQDYQTYGRGKVALDWIDPVVGTARKDAEDAGIQFIPVKALEGDKVVQKSVAFGLRLLYRDREKLIPAIWLGDLPTIEYQLTTAIKSLVDPKKKTVGFLTREAPSMPRFPGMDMPPQGRIFETARKVLEDRYAILDIDVKKDPVPDEVEVLVVAKPSDFTDKEKFELDQFLMRGGRVLFAVDKDEYQKEMNFQRKPVTTGLDDLFEHYGFRVEKELVFDKSNFPVQAPGEVVEIFGQKARLQREMPYPFWVRVAAAGFSKDNPITGRLDAAAFLWAHPVTVIAEKAKGWKVEDLIRSSEASWRTDQTDKATPEEKNLKQIAASLTGKPPAPTTMAMAISGKFSSFYQGKEIPKGPQDAKPEGETPEEKKPEEPQRTVIAESPETRILVFGDADFMADWAAMKPNLILFVNAVDWLGLDQDLIGIRSKTVRDRRILDFEQEYAKDAGPTNMNVEDLFSEQAEEKYETVRTNVSEVKERARRTTDLIKWGNMLGMPLLVVAIGLARFVTRRSRKTGGDA